jgi:hypothetical protein
LFSIFYFIFCPTISCFIDEINIDAQRRKIKLAIILVNVYSSKERGFKRGIKKVDGAEMARSWYRGKLVIVKEIYLFLFACRSKRHDFYANIIFR